MARHIARNAALAAVVFAGSASLAAAQPRMNRGPNPDAPKLMVSACKAPDKALAVQCADRIRSQIEGDVSFRSLVVMSKADVENTLTASGYDPAMALAPGDAIALAKQLHADMYIDATAEKAGAGFKITAAVVLSRDANMKQPLGEFDHARIETVSGQISKSFQDAFNKTYEPQKDCFTRERERKYDDALKAVNDGLKAYPSSAWLRHCKLAVMKSQRAPGKDVAALLEEIIAADATNRTALRDLVVIYETEGNKDKKIATLELLRAADPTDPTLAAQIVNTYAEMGLLDKARAVVEPAIAQNPGDINLVRPYWLILMNAKEYKKAIEVGKTMATMDTSTADTSYFQRMISAASADSNFAEAASLADRAVTKFPTNAQFHTFAVAAHQKAGNPAASVAAAQRALRAMPDAKGLRAQIAVAYLGESPPKIEQAIAMAKEMLANGEDKDQVAAVAVQSGNLLRAAIDSTTSLAQTERVLAVTQWADTLATGSSLAAQAKFVMGVAAMTVGQRYLNQVGEIGTKIQADFKTASSNEAKQRVLDEAYPRACATTNKANEYFTLAQGALPAGGRFDPRTAQQVMGSLMQLNGFVEQYVKAYCKKP